MDTFQILVLVTGFLFMGFQLDAQARRIYKLEGRVDELIDEVAKITRDGNEDFQDEDE